MKKTFVAIFVLLCVSGAGIRFFWVSTPLSFSITGYAIADTMYMATPIAGTVQTMHVSRGQYLTPTTPLFSLNATTTLAKRKQVESDIARQYAQIDFEASKKIKAQESFAIAETEEKRTNQDLQRYLKVWNSRPEAVTKETMDHIRLAAITATLQKNAAAQEVAAADASIRIATAAITRLEADLDIIDRQLEEIAPLSPVSGRVEDIMIQQGEWAAANTPIVSIVPNDKVKVRFYVSENELASYPLHTKIRINWTGAPAPSTATVTYIAPQAEFTPPVIYSLSTKHKLVFCIEAAPDEPQRLIPGQPLQIERVAEQKVGQTS